MIDRELVYLGCEDPEIVEEKDSHWVVMHIAMIPVYTVFFAFFVWVIKKIVVYL